MEDHASSAGTISRLVIQLCGLRIEIASTASTNRASYLGAFRKNTNDKCERDSEDLRWVRQDKRSNFHKIDVILVHVAVRISAMLRVKVDDGSKDTNSSSSL